MGTTKYTSLLSCLVAVCWFSSVSNAIADSRLSILPGMLYFDYEETAEDGSFLDGETDPVSGLSLEFEHIFSNGFRGVINAGFYTGNVEYDGHAYPSGQPVTTYTKENFYHVGAVAKLPFHKSGLKSYFNIGYEFRRWERDIRPTVSPAIGSVSGLYEIYEWGELSLGWEVNHKDKSSHQWTFYAGAFQTIDPRIDIDLTADDNGKPRLFMGSDTGFKFSALWITTKKARSNAGVKLTYKTWRFGRSNSEVLPDNSVVTEPRSRTRIVMFEFLLAMDI